jgi:GNAT superfamily N-acetyltransferase
MIEAACEIAGQVFKVRPAREGDVEAATRVINAAFSTWAALGVDVGFRANQPLELVRSFLLEDGFVAETGAGEIAAAFCARQVVPETDGQHVTVPRAHQTDRSVLIPEEMEGAAFSRMRLVYFYTLAVAPPYAKHGLGGALLRLIEKTAAETGCDGVLLETGKRNAWLVEWYARCGYRIIGRYPFPEQETRSIFMLKAVPR